MKWIQRICNEADTLRSSEWIINIKILKGIKNASGI